MYLIGFLIFLLCYVVFSNMLRFYYELIINFSIKLVLAKEFDMFIIAASFFSLSSLHKCEK